MSGDKNPAHYRNRMRRALRRFRDGKIGGEQLANDVDGYLRAWDAHRNPPPPPEMLYMRDVDGTGSMHPCAKDDPGAVAYLSA